MKSTYRVFLLQHLDRNSINTTQTPAHFTEDSCSFGNFCFKCVCAGPTGGRREMYFSRGITHVWHCSKATTLAGRRSSPVPESPANGGVSFRTPPLRPLAILGFELPRQGHTPQSSGAPQPSRRLAGASPLPASCPPSVHPDGAGLCPQDNVCHPDAGDSWHLCLGPSSCP